MRKAYAILIALILVLPALSFVAPVRASTGAPDLATINFTTNMATQATFNVSIAAGNLTAAAVDNIANTDYFAIIFSINGTNVNQFKWSGAQFGLYISQDGLSSISSGDVNYTQLFNVADLNGTGLKEVNMTNPNLKGGMSTFWIGTANVSFDGGVTYLPVQMLVGPIPFNITSNYKFIKIFDGSSGAVAVAAQQIIVLPAVSITPDSGPAGTLVTLSGVALLPNEVYNITYDTDSPALVQVTTDSLGTFSTSWNIEDLCADFNHNEALPITISVIDNASGSTVATVIFTENSRAFLQLSTLQADDWLVLLTQTPIGNFTGYMDAYVNDTVTVTGIAFNPTAPVVISIEGTTVDTVPTSAINASGFFNTTFMVPILSLGDHNVTVTNGGCTLLFGLDVLATLIVTPSSGPIGTTVTFTGYGFPGNSTAYIYWYTGVVCSFDEAYQWVANVTVGDNGQFNITVTYVVPAQPGGTHEIDAFSQFFGDSTNSPDFGYFIASTTFTVTPTIAVTPSTIDNNGSYFYLNATGLLPYEPYSINLDNHGIALPNLYNYVLLTYYGSINEPGLYLANYGSDSIVFADACGDLIVQLSAAGFYPGTHSITLYGNGFDYFWGTDSFSMGNTNVYNYYWGNYTIDANALFTVSTTDDAVIQAVNSTMQQQFAQENAQITSIANGVATIQTNTQQLLVNVAALNATVVTINGNVATIMTTVGQIQGTVTSMSGDLATVKTDVGTIQAKVTTGPVPIDMTLIYVAIILAAIAAIFSIIAVISIRSKIAA